jgi:glucokinase
MQPEVNQKSPHVIGIDIGGTKIAAAIVDTASGTPYHRQIVPTEPEKGGEYVYQTVSSLIRQLEEKARNENVVLLGIGLGLCEIIDNNGQIRSDTLVKWRGRILQREFSLALPVHLVSDVRAAALAEACFGAARNLKSALYVSIGTGISSVLLLNGVPHSGARGAALVLTSAHTLCSCSNCGALSRINVEEISSGPAMASHYTKDPNGDARQVISAAERGDAEALGIISRATAVLGSAVGQLANCIDPEVVIIGGGLGSAAGAYWEQLRVNIQQSLWSGIDGHAAIVQSALKQDAGVIGSALAFEKGIH